MRLLTCLLVLGLSTPVVFAGETGQFNGSINSDQTNIRIDSTVSSNVICKINKGERVEVVKELYDWYKIRLPSNAPAYIKKSFTFLLPTDKNPAARTAKVEKDNVNIRLGPGEDTSVIGKAGKNEILSITSETPLWYQIQPTQNCFGWINKQFVNKCGSPAAVIKPPEQAATQKKSDAKDQLLPKINEDIILEGTVSPYGMVIGRKATHKLTTSENKQYLLKYNKKSLDDLNFQKVKVTGEIISLGARPVINVKKMEIAE